MANVIPSSGDSDQACTIGTTHTLFSNSAEGNYTLSIDFDTAADGDWFEVWAEENARSGGTKRQVGDVYTIIGGQAGALFKTDPYDVLYGINFKILQLAGTGRTLPWRVTELG